MALLRKLREEDCYKVFCTDEGPKTIAPYMVELLCQGKPIKMEVDTGTHVQ